MELKELTEKTMEIFDAKTLDEFKENIKKAVFSNDFKKYNSFKALVKNLDEDWLQKIFQYYFADRKDLKQDYTPSSLAKLVSVLTQTQDEKTCLDLCAGSGALTIQKWKTNKELNFICEELDENVIPFLLFNLAIRNIGGYVIHRDVLDEASDKITYKIERGEEFGKITKVRDVECKADSCISNPPYNIPWDVPVFASVDERFIHFDVPPKNNANFAFVLTALAKTEGKIALILPNAILKSERKQESLIRKNLVEQNLIEAVILNADNMFVSTAIGTCILLLNKHKTTSKIEFIDMRQTFTEKERGQRGQFGGSQHTNRVYKKMFKTYSDEQIKKILQTISNMSCEKGFCACVSIEDVKKKEYSLKPNNFIELEEWRDNTRSYEDIISDLNRVITQKNACKLTINETTAKQLGFDVDLYKVKSIDENNLFQKITGCKIKKENYITFSRRKNEIKFENGEDEMISHILLMILKSWKEFIFYLNTEENRYLAELRDKMLPDLMSGKISVND